MDVAIVVGMPIFCIHWSSINTACPNTDFFSRWRNTHFTEVQISSISVCNFQSIEINTTLNKMF